MNRYIKIFLLSIHQSLCRDMQFKHDLFGKLALDAVNYLIFFGMYGILFKYVDMLEGWSYEQALLFVSGFIFVDAVVATFFLNNISELSYAIHNGKFDLYLIIPINLLFYSVTRSVVTPGFMNCIISICAILYFSIKCEISTFGILLYFLLLMNGVGLLLFLLVLSTIPIFWGVSRKGLMTLFWELKDVGQRPDKIFNGVTRIILVYILPFGVLASLPARTVINGVNSLNILIIFLVSAFNYSTIICLWNFGKKRYTSVA